MYSPCTVYVRRYDLDQQRGVLYLLFLQSQEVTLSSAVRSNQSSQTKSDRDTKALKEWDLLIEVGSSPLLSKVLLSPHCYILLFNANIGAEPKRKQWRD